MTQEDFDPFTDRFSDFEGLRRLVDQAGGLLRVSMYQLRVAHGAGKLGVRVREEIVQRLEGAGLGFFPGPELPAYQEQDVRIYRRGTAVGSVVDAVLRPSSTGDQLLLESRSDEAANVLKQVRALICTD
jgi:hypothetical protein